MLNLAFVTVIPFDVLSGVPNAGVALARAAVGWVSLLFLDGSDVAVTSVSGLVVIACA